MTSITTLPEELILRVFSELDPVYSTCLGLTCRRFYGIHFETHGKVPLLTETKCTTPNANGKCSQGVYSLHQSLRCWAGPRLVFCYLDKGKFMTPSRRLERMEEFVQENRTKIWRVVYRNYQQMAKEMKAELEQGVFPLGNWSCAEECSQMLSMYEGNMNLCFGLSGELEGSFLFRPFV